MKGRGVGKGNNTKINNPEKYHAKKRRELRKMRAKWK